MTNTSLAQSYLVKAQKRLLALRLLFEHEAYSDVVREAQEAVELALKGMLRQVGIEPPKWHDVGALLVEQADRFPPQVRAKLGDLSRISAWLRKEREFSFYGEVDFVPTERYSRADAERALQDAEAAVQVASVVIPK